MLINQTSYPHLGKHHGKKVYNFGGRILYSRSHPSPFWVIDFDQALNIKHIQEFYGESLLYGP